MKTISCIFSCSLICLFAVFMMGMEGCDNRTDDEPYEAVSFIAADPVSGSTIQPNQLITVTFDGSPAFVNVSEGITTLTENTLTIAGLKPGELSLVLEWPDGIKTLVYIIQSPPVIADLSEEIIQDVWVDYNVWEGGQKGMRIHVKFTLSTEKNSQCSVTMSFEYRVLGVRLLDWRPLIDVNGKYTTTDGKVAVAKDFVHDSIETTYDDFNIFMPYSELHADKIKVKAEEADAVANAINDDLVILFPSLRCIIKIENRTLGTLLDSSEVTFRYRPALPDLKPEADANGF